MKDNSNRIIDILLLAARVPKVKNIPTDWYFKSRDCKEGSIFTMKYSKSTLVVLFILAGFTVNSFGQIKDIEYSNQQWIQYYNQLKLSEQWTLLTDGEVRWKNGFSQKSLYIARTGIGYQLHPFMRFSIGFAHAGFYTADTLSRIEYRPYQDFLITNNYGNIRIAHRLRSEERYFKNISDETDNFNFRFRYRFLLSIPLLRFHSANPDSKLILRLGDEIFINAGKEVVYNIFDQNRILFEPVIQLNKNLSVSITYNHQLLAKNAPGEYKQDDVFWLGVKQTMALTRKQQPKD